MIDCEFLGFTINAKFNGCTYEDYDKCLNDAGYKRDTYKLPSKYVENYLPPIKVVHQEVPTTQVYPSFTNTKIEALKSYINMMKYRSVTDASYQR